MKKTIGLLITLLLLSVSVQAGIDPNRWAGFRDLKWGTNIKDVNDPNMILIEAKNETSVYKRLNDKLSIGDAELAEITYFFYKDRFFSVIVRARGITNFKALKDAIFARYGEGKQNNEYIEYWIWSSDYGNSSKDIEMSLDYNEFSKRTKWFMYYVPIREEQKADNARKAKEAGKDF